MQCSMRCCCRSHRACRAIRPLLIGIDIGVTLTWYAMLLRIAQKPERYLQTVTAVLGFQLVLAPHC